MNEVKITETVYFGIYVQEENGHFWIVDDEGGEQDMGDITPTAEQIKAYRNRVVKAYR